MPDEQRYISSQLAHFVGSDHKSDEELYRLLTKILKEGWITYPPHDESTKTDRHIITYPTKNICDSTNEMYEPSMVCFCDIPVDDLKVHVKKYGPFGLAFDKEFIASNGGVPVYYIPKKAGSAWPKRDNPEVDERKEAFDQGVRKCHDLLEELSRIPEWREKARDVDDFLATYIFAYIQGFDHRLADDHQDNYYFEREWRTLTSLHFEVSDVVRIFLPKEPEKYADRFRKDFPDYCGELSFL